MAIGALELFTAVTAIVCLQSLAQQSEAANGDRTASSGGRSFYVSSTTGDDSHSGLSPSSAWKSLEHAAAAAGKLGASDCLLLRAGDDWQLSAPLVLEAHGSASAPAVIGAYTTNASGSPSTDGKVSADACQTARRGFSASSVLSPQRPWVRRTTPTGKGVGPVVQCSNCSEVAVVGLHISGGEQGLLFHFAGPAEAGAAWEGMEVSDCFFSDIRGTKPASGSATWWGTALGFATVGRSDVHAGEVTIKNNIFNDSDVAYANCITAQVWAHQLQSLAAVLR